MNQTLLFPFLFLLQFTWFIFPGLFIVFILKNRLRIPNVYIVPTGLVTSGIIGYTIFWAYLYHNWIGRMLTIVLLLLVPVFCFLLFANRRYRSILAKPDVQIPLLLWLAISFFYLSLVFGCSTTNNPGQLDNYCHLNGITFDHILPKIFAQNVYDGNPKTLIGDWQGSDRPPLMSGIVLAQSFLTLESQFSNMSYQIQATIAQVSWVPIIWLIARKLNLSFKRVIIMIVLCLTAGFFFFNSAFTWPKLLAGTFSMIGFTLLFYEKPSIKKWMIAATALALSFLSHTGIALAFIPIGLLLLLRQRNIDYKMVSVAACTGMLLLLPWIAYQKYFDPPGDRLLKWGMAGVTQPSDKNFTKELVNSYSAVGLKGTYENKIQNAVGLVFHPLTAGSLYTRDIEGRARDLEFRFVSFSLGILWVGILCFFFLKQTRIKLSRDNINVDFLETALKVSILTLTIWFLAMFDPSTVVVHASPYLAIMLLFIVSVVALTALPAKILNSLVIIKIVYFGYFWVLSIYLAFEYNFVYIIYCLFIVLAAVAAYLYSGHKFESKIWSNDDQTFN